MLFASCNAYGKVIIWDLGDVLVSLSKLGMARPLIGHNVITYTIWDWQNPLSLHDRALESLKYWHGESKLELKDRSYLCNRIPMPALLCLWQAGKICQADVQKEVTLLLEDLDHAKFFKNQREKALISDILISTMFNPDLFAANVAPVRRAIKLLGDVAKAHDEHGNRNELFILSNWDPYSFEIFRNSKRGRFIRRYFKPENIVISGNLKALKPSSDCFKAFFSKYPKLHPADCIFIDDQPENIDAAVKYGIQGVLLEDSYVLGFIRHGKDYGRLRKQLQELGVFGTYRPKASLVN